MMIEEITNAMTVLAGQILLVQLKGDEQALERFRTKYLTHITNFFGLNSREEIISETTKASRRFAALLARRYGMERKAAECMISLLANAASEWIAGVKSDNVENALLRIDAWSGFASVTANGVPCPLSLVDETLEILLPIICGDEVRAAVESVWAVGTDVEESLEGLEAALEACVSKLVGGVDLAERVMDELKLIVLLHLPKEDEQLAAYEGMAYGTLKGEYAQKEVK